MSRERHRPGTDNSELLRQILGPEICNLLIQEAHELIASGKGNDLSEEEE